MTEIIVKETKVAQRLDQLNAGDFFMWQGTVCILTSNTTYKSFKSCSGTEYLPVLMLRDNGRFGCDGMEPCATIDKVIEKVSIEVEV